MYKCNFPLDRFKPINTICSSIFTEYFISESGFVYGTSNLKWCLRIAVLPNRDEDLLPMLCNAIIPPNATRTMLSNAKKTMTYVDISDESIDFLLYKEKIDSLVKDKKNITSEELRNINHETFALRRFKKGDNSEAEKIAKDIACHVGPYAAMVEEKDFYPIDLDSMGEAFRAESVYTVIDEDDPENAVMFSKQMLPDYNKVKYLSWKPYILNDTYSIGVFRAEYDEIAVFTFIKFIKGII